MSDIEREIPIRDDLFVDSNGADGTPKLLVRRCKSTGNLYFPRNSVFSGGGDYEDLEIEGKGRLIEAAVIQRGLPGFVSPYAIAVIELDQGLSLIAQLEDWEDKSLDMGTRVRLVIGCIRKERDGSRIVGPKFKVS